MVLRALCPIFGPSVTWSSFLLVGPALAERYPSFLLPIAVAAGAMIIGSPERWYLNSGVQAAQGVDGGTARATCISNTLTKLTRTLSGATQKLQ